MMCSRPRGSDFQVLIVLALVGLQGCATLPKPGCGSTSASQTDGISVVYGKPNRVADGVGRVLGAPARLLAMDSRVNNHQFSDSSRDKLVRFLEEHQIEDVCVRVNQYDPAGEWQRLRENTRLAPGWRYSVGLLELAAYTLIPGRIFGGDHYSPFTNSLSINSDLPAVALHEAAYADDIHNRSLPGTYATINELPVVSLWHHCVAVRDVLDYARSEHDWELEQETYRVVYPHMGSRMFLATGPLVGPLEAIGLQLGGAFAGRMAGEWALIQECRKRADDSPPEIEAVVVRLVSSKVEDDPRTEATNSTAE